MSERAQSVLLTLLLVVSTFSTVGVGAAAPTSSPADFHVMQNGECHEVTTVGNGENSVEEFYDYRSGSDTLYGSYGEGSQEIQENQVSHLFVYDGSQGLSLVMLHDDLNETEGGAITFDISGLPEDHQWMIEDDNYEGRDDNFQYDGTSAKIDWMWAPDRTDGGVVRGLGNDFSAITIDPAFGEESWAYQERDSQWPHAEDEMSWQLQSGTGEEIPLDKTQSLSLSKGGCPDTTDPEAALTASPNPVANDESVTLDATASEDNREITEYRWDFDDDGDYEETTDSATVKHTYSSTGNHDASVEVVDGNDNSDTATVTVEVEPADQSPPTTTTTETTTTPTTTETTTEGTTTTETTTTTSTTPTTTTTTPTTTSTTPTTTETTTTTSTTPTTTTTETTTTPTTTTTTTTPDNTDPSSALSVSPSSVGNNEEVTLDASDSTDDGGSGIDEYRWDFDGDDEPERTTDSATVTHTYSGVGEYEVAVTVVDGNGNTDTATETVTVREQSNDDPPSDDPPNAKLTAPDSGSMSQLIYPFDASASTDDEGIVAYRWDFNGDGKVEWTEKDPISSLKPYQVLDGPGTYEATVTVVDESGQTDTASVEYTVKKVAPDAAITASSNTVEVGEKVSFEATDFNEAPDTLEHICWKVGDEAGPEGTTWTTSFEEPGKKTVKLVLEDRAGYENVVKKTITVTAADEGDDSGDNGNDGDSGDSDDSNPDEGGLEDDDDESSTGGGIPAESPADTGGPNGGNDDSQTDETVSAPLNSSDGQVGTVTLHASGSSDPEIEAMEVAPEDVESPTVERDGFAALSYLTVSGADRATFTVSQGLLDASGAAAEDVTLFRNENGTWTAVETEQVGQTDDAYRFGANVSEGTYAVGIDRPATSVTDVSVGSERVEPGESVTVTATVENTGRAEGTREVVLTVGGEEVATETVSLEAGATKDVTFSRTFDSGGVYEIGAGDATAEVVVKGVETETTTDESGVATSTQTTTASDGGIPGFGVGVTLVALVAAALVALRRS